MRTGLDTGVRFGAVAAVSAGMFCIQLDAFALNLALPQIGKDLEVAPGALQWAVSGYLLTVGTFMLGAGSLSDSLGHRRVVMVGLSLFCLSSILAAASVSLPMLLLARVLQGLGGALIMPAGLALLTQLFPPDARGRATGYAIGIGGLATAIGPFVGGLLTQSASWRVVFWINVPISLWGVLWARVVREERNSRLRGRLDAIGLAMITGALAVLSALVDYGGHLGWGSARTVSVLVVVVVLFIVFIRHENHTRSPLIDFSLFHNKAFDALTFAGAVSNASTVVFLFVVPLSLQGSWGLSASASGIAFLAPSTLMALAGPIAGSVKTDMSVKVMSLCMVCASAMLGCAAASGSLRMYLLTVAAGGAALGVANALTLVATQGVVQRERAGEASGVTKTVITLAAGVGVALSGSVADQAAGLDVRSTATTALVVSAMSCLGVAVGLLAWSVWRHLR